MAVNPARKGWDIDLADGEAREDAFRDVLLHRYVEHKSDFKCVETGNLAVEYETSAAPNGEGNRWPSGIGTTTSDYWAVEFAPDCWLVLRTATMKGFAREAIRRGHHRWIGDDNRFHNALVPFHWCINIALADERKVAA